MIEKYSAALQTYFTRRVPMIVIAAASLGIAAILCNVGFSRPWARGYSMMSGNLICLPIMGMVFFLVQQAKWQFVHPRARLTPHFATAHLGVLGCLLVMLVGFYPLCVSQMLGVSALGISSYAAFFGAAVAWGTHTTRPIFMLVGMALFYSSFIPRFRGLWTESNPRLLPIYVAIFLAGWTGLALWLRRLTQMTEEAEDYLIPVQAQFGQASRMEKSEARRTLTTVLGRAKMQSWITDRWHDRLAQVAPQTDLDRRRLLSYGMAPTPAIVRGLFFMILMSSVALLTLLMLNDNDSPARRSPVIMQMSIFAMIGPMMSSQFLATRRARLSQELLLPLTRQSLVDGLLRALLVENLQFIGMAGFLISLLAAALAPDLLTPLNITAAVLSIVSIQPALTGSAFWSALIASGMKRMFQMLFVLYASMAAVAGVFALSVFVNLGYGVLLSLAIWALGWQVIRAARNKWLQVELG